MLRSGDRKTIFVAICGGLYWSSMLLAFFGWNSATYRSGFETSFGNLEPLIAVATIGILYLLHDRFSQRKQLAAIAFFIAIGYSAIIAIRYLGLTPYPVGNFAMQVLPGVFSACMVSFIGLNFASLNKREAENTVFYTLLITFALYLGGSVARPGEFAFLILSFMRIAAVLPFLFGWYDIEVVKREAAPNALSILTPFVLSRCFYGFSCGLLLMNLQKEELNSIPWLCILGCSFIVACGVYAVRKQREVVSVVRIAPILALAPLLLPFVEESTLGIAVSESAYSIVWLSWTILASVQLSDIKTRVGWSETRLVFFEKLVFVLSGLLGGYFASTMQTFDSQIGSSFAFDTLPFILLPYFAIALTLYLLSNLIQTKELQRVIHKTLHLTESQKEAIFDEIAEEHGLTRREGDVLRLLALGHGRPYLCRRLCISEGTARAHINHIYKKLDIHSREELLAYVSLKEESYRIASANNRYDSLI